jgi:hypothetical protein
MSKQTELAQVADTITVDSGKIGIGTSSPDTSLTIGAGGKVRLYRGDNTRYGDIYTDNNFLNIETSNDPIRLGGQSYIRFDTNSTERMRIDASGRVTTPSQPFILLSTTGYTTGNNAALQFNQVQQSRNLSWNGSTHSFTVPVTGVYTFSAATRLNTNTLNYMYHRVIVNGSSYPWSNMLILQKPNALDSFQTINTSFQVYLVANDSVQISINYNGSGSHSVNGQSWMSVALLG